MLLVRLEAIYRCNVGVVERSENLGFPLEPGETLRIRRDHLRKDLDRDCPLQVSVGRSIHFAHPAHAELGSNLIRAEARPTR